MTDNIKKQFEKAEKVERPEPLPLRREGAPPEPYPVRALGKILGDAVDAIVDIIQCPEAIAAQSVLGAAALASQAHIDVVHPATKEARPVSLFFVTVAASGERKSAADRYALSPINLRQADLHEQYKRDYRMFCDAEDAYRRSREHVLRQHKADRAEAEKQLAALGAAPISPLRPVLTASDVTIEGLYGLMAEAEPSIGLFNDEGATVIGGHSMLDESRAKTGAGLSSLWDGTPVVRARSGDGLSMLIGRRFSMHIMVQPGIADGLLADPTLMQQGLTSRVLVTAPASKAGTRMQKTPAKSSEQALKRYDNMLLKLLRMKQPRLGLGDVQLKPRPIKLSAAAYKKWKALADKYEAELAAGCRLEPVRSFANKLAEHALRIAAVLQFVENPNSKEISAANFGRAATLSRYYAGEALRFSEQGSASIEIQNAEKILAWCREKGKTRVGLKEIYQYGPYTVRNAASARQAMAILEQNYWVVRIEGGAKIDGKRHREAWEIVQI